MRYIVGYKKIPNKFGDYKLLVKYKLSERVPLLFLQKLFGIDPGDPNENERYLSDCYEIDLVRAQALQPFFKEKLDLEKYDFMLE